MNAQQQTVTFHGQSISVFTQNNQHYVAMKPICENIGLDWRAQRQRIMRHDIMKQGVVIITTPDKAGQMQETNCLPLEYLNGWLFGVDAARVKPEIKPRLLQYQRECFKVLSAHFMQPRTLPQTPDTELAAQLPTRDNLYHLYLMLADRMKEIHNWGDINLDNYIQNRFGQTAANCPFGRLVYIIRHLQHETERFVQREKPLLIIDTQKAELEKLLHYEQLHPIVVLCQYALRLSDGINDVAKVLELLDSRFLCRLSTTAHEMRIQLRHTLCWVRKMQPHSQGNNHIFNNANHAQRILADMNRP